MDFIINTHNLGQYFGPQMFKNLSKVLRLAFDKKILKFGKLNGNSLFIKFRKC